MNANEIVKKINNVELLAAGVEENDGEPHAGLIYVEHMKPNKKDCVGFQIENLIPESVKDLIEFVDADNSSSFVWFRVK